MAYVSPKITDFPNRPDPGSPIPSSSLDGGRDPAREIRSLIEKLEEAAREAHRHQRAAEEECERLRFKLAEVEVRAESARASDPNLKALIKERDMLIEQQNQYGPLISELKQKLKNLEADRIDAFRQRDESGRAQKQAQREIDTAQRAAREAESKLENAIRQRDLARQEKDEALAKAGEAKKNFSDAQKALATSKKDDPDVEKQLASVRQARDGMAAQVSELKRKIGELEDEAAELTYNKEAAENALKEAREEQERLQNALEEAKAAGSEPGKVAELEAALNRKNAGSAENEEQLVAELEELRKALAAVSKERDLSTQAIGEAQASSLAAQKQMEAIVRERDAIKRELAGATAKLEAALNEQIAENLCLKEEVSAAKSQLSERERMGAHHEKRRLDMIEIATQLENAQRDIRILSASLAESRLQAKLAAKKAATDASQAKDQSKNAEAIAGDEAPGNATIVAMRRCFQTFSHDRNQLSLLKELETHAQRFAESARDHGLPVLHRVTVAFATLLGDLYEIPDHVSPETLSTMNQSIEFIGALLNNPEIEQTINLGDARVYVVDDDQNTCDMMVAALNMVGLQARYALYSSTAVAELAGSQYDLIILDVNLPDLDGFELCSHIRNMAFHAETPVFFITGHTSLENRVKSSLRGGNEFIGKPFNIQELALKALKSVIQSQLHTAGR